MKILFRNDKIEPIVSLVLLDWSCRESFHILHYLANQTVPRDQYEIIWIEYYSRRSVEIAAGLKECGDSGKPPILDNWIVMNMPDGVYYHKHLMYNIGIAFSRGRIVTVCDSDAIVRPTFVESIINTFEKSKNIVLHLDEVRNVNRKFYPFNFPSIEEVAKDGCINWRGKKTTGILERKDPIHSRNYGACMCALREDLITIGGADEHIDYLGHICGPYEMTFRLVNAGKKELWHQKDFLYHVWHPGTDGLNNYLGPHDGKNVSSRALEARAAGRILPWLENAAIKEMRLNKKTIDRESLSAQVINQDFLSEWQVDKNKFLISFGRIAYHRKEFAEALKNWQEVSGPMALDDNFLSEFGWAYYFQSEYAKAIEIFNKTLRINEENQFARVGLGWAHIQNKSFSQAKEHFDNALKIKAHKDPALLKDAARGLEMLRRIAPDGVNISKKGLSRSLSSHIVVMIARSTFIHQYYRDKIIGRIINRDFRMPESLKYKIKKLAILRPFLNNDHAAVRGGYKSPEIKGLREHITYGGYPCDIPIFNIKPNLDFLLLELPPRYMPMMPNGLGYVHNILTKCGINFQTIDANIAAYHKYHERRIRQRLYPIITSSGYKMVEDPWDNTNTTEWDREEVIEYFMRDLKEIIFQISQQKPKAVGISLNGCNRSLVKSFVKELREVSPETTIVVGGYDCVYYGMAQYLFFDFDYMVIGEAELTLAALINELAKGKQPKDLPGIVSRNDTPKRLWTKPPLLQDLDSVDFPRYQWASHIWYQTYDRKHLIPIAASRGCNWARCRFCGECFAFRRREPKKVVDEIEYHTKLGFHTFHFNESDVNGDPQTLYDLCSEVIRRKLDVKFVAQLRIDKRNTAEYFRHLKKAGFMHLRFGVDGWTDNLIHLQNKGYNIELVFQNLRDCHKTGITTTVNMVIGVPGETESDIDEAIRNIIRCGDCISLIESFNTLLLVCGSEYYRNPEKYKIHFRENKEEIYQKYVNFIPPDLWYSEDPYIDQNVRMKRLEKILSALHKNGVNIGGFAAKVVEDLREARVLSQCG